MLESTWKQGSDAQRELFHVLDSPNLDVNLEWETFLKAKHNMFDETAKKFALDQTINKSIEFHKWNQNCRMVKARNTPPKHVWVSRRNTKRLSSMQERKRQNGVAKVASTPYRQTRRHGNSKTMHEAPLRCPRRLHYGPFPASSARNWAASELAASNEPNWLQDSGGSTEVRNALTCLLWRPMVKFSLAMKIPLRPSQTTGNPLGMQQDIEHNSHCLNNSPWWPWCRISFSHFTVTMQASAQLWLIWRRRSNTFMALQDRTSGPAQNFELYPCHYGKMGNIRPNA